MLNPVTNRPAHLSGIETPRRVSRIFGQARDFSGKLGFSGKAGSIYGGRAIHIYVSGGDLSLVKAEFSRLIKLAQDSLSHAFP